MDSSQFPTAESRANVEGQFANYYTSKQLDRGQLDGRYYTKRECQEMFAGSKETCTKKEVQDAIAAAIAALDDCPPGYEKVPDPSVAATGFFCCKPVAGGKYDEMVKAGDSWGDRYEMSLWDGKGLFGESVRDSGWRRA